MSEKTDDDILQMSAEARAVWSNPLVQDFMNNKPLKVFAEWLVETDPVRREELWNLAQGISLFKQEFMNHMAAGRTAQRKRDGSIADNVGPII